MTRLALTSSLSDRQVRFASAVTAWMSVVGIVYSLLLRNTWSLQGWQKVADALLHDVLPLLTLLFWIFAIPRGRLRWTSPLPWLLYPLAYLAFILLFGPAFWSYPYPFADVRALGYPRALINSLAMTLFFLAISYALVFADRILAKVEPQ